MNAFHELQNTWTEPRFALFLFKVRTPLQLSEHQLTGSKTWLSTRVTELQFSYMCPVFPPTYLNTDCQLFFSRPWVSTGYGHEPSTRYSYLHSFMWTHQRGRGDELSTRIHHDRTWWSGQPSKLVIIRGLLCKERNTLNTSKKYDSGLILLLACRVQSVQSYAVTQVRSKLASTRTLSRKTAR